MDIGQRINTGIAQNRLTEKEPKIGEFEVSDTPGYDHLSVDYSNYSSS